jgi:hypothetical protein
MGKGSTYNVSIDNPEAKRVLRRLRCGWENNVEVDFKEMEWEGMDWTYPHRNKDQ